MESTEPQSLVDNVKPEKITTNDKEFLPKEHIKEEATEPSESDLLDEGKPLQERPITDDDFDFKIEKKIEDIEQETEILHVDSSKQGDVQENDTESMEEQQEIAEKEEGEVEVEVEENLKQTESHILKLNGNHSLCIRDDDENSCSSTASSASSHNLVIDHPLAEENRPTKSTEDNGPIEKIPEGKSLKRKLSICENGSPQYKQIHLEVEVKSPPRETEINHQTQSTISEVETVPKVAEALPESGNIIKDALRKSLPTVSMGLEISISPPCPKETPPPVRLPSPSPFDMYAGSSHKSLPSPILNFDCFKCKNAVFDTFTQLREHHKVCLFREKRRKLPQPPTVTPACNTAVNESCALQPIQLSEPPPNAAPPLNALPPPNALPPTNALSPPNAAPTPKAIPPPNAVANAMPPPKITPSATPTKKRFYLCSSCGTYHENWNLFLHIREIHNRHVCLYCIRLFPTAEKLSLHLEIKHDLEQNHFYSEEKLRSVSKGDGNSRFLMCCTCQHVFSEHERFSDHICTEYMQPCSLCNQKGRHQNNCKGNPEKRPKVKKKAKLTAPATITKSNTQLPRSAATTTTGTSSVLPVGPALSVTSVPLAPPVAPIPPMVSIPLLASAPTLPQPPLAFPTISDNKINNNQMVLSALPPPIEFSKQNGFSEPPTDGILQRKPSLDTNYHSDDSTNMVIDETCASNNYVDEMSSVNPFKALDDREQEQQETHKIAETRTATLAPDRVVPEAILEPKPLIVPKIKLRVPKEFQKAVESEISSTDSDDDDDEDVDEEQPSVEGNPKKHVYGPQIPLENNVSPAGGAAANAIPNEDFGSDDNDGGCWDESNTNLDRILKEIEKTKLDIQRTKELLEPMNNPKKVPTGDEATNSPCHAVNLPALEEENHCEAPEKSLNWTTPQRGMYSPTPPATPSSAWASPLYMSEVSPAVLQAVSERENIENMEKESEHAKEPPPESDKMEVDVESDHNQEESTMDIEETAKSQKNSVTPPLMDFTPIVDNEVKPLDNETPLPIIPDKEPEIEEEIDVVSQKMSPFDGIEVANEDIQITDLLLDRPIEKFEIVEFVRLCVKAVYSLCLYCNHARRIAVSGHSLVLHLLAQHRFSATVDSITAEELLPSTIVSKLKGFLPDLEEQYFNLQSYCSIPPKETNTIAFDERVFECFQCRFSTNLHKDLYLHNRKMHLKTAILCFMCRSNFFSFSEILCHICPGIPNKVTVFDIKFRCCLCDVDGILSPFRLMVHLRKKHFACDVCLEDCHEQAKLSSHVWKHKLHHLCYRCGIAYRNKMDITKHLFWKHGTESIICKRCLQKRWRHVYHFCIPPTSFVCDVCNLCFSKATYLKVHKRLHSGDFRYPCTEDDCEEKFISRKLLLKHSVTHAPPPEIKVEEKVENKLEVKIEPVDQAKVEEAPKEEKAVAAPSAENEEPSKVEDTKVDKSSEPVSKRKKKKNRNKESLEDLNLIAPNLSESDSSDDSDAEKPKTDDKDSLVPNVMLSPPSEEEKDEDKESGKQTDKDTDTGKIMDIWENFKTFQASQQPKKEEDDNLSFSESDYPTPILHVVCSDHDYCAMYKVRPRLPVEEQKVEPEVAEVKSDTERDGPDVEMREKTISPSKKKRKSAGSGSSSSDSSSGSDSSCSCGSNCSCSTSGSSSNSSSSSDEDSDSSTSAGRRRIAEKKQERADRSRWKNESATKANLSESAIVVVEEEESIAVTAVKDNLEPVLIETDLETAESQTDEEFYDEHPQKLASELLAQKRLQLRAQMRLSPSHNFDIMENSRPSTPSLPEEVVKEKKVKLKKKKRDRKSTSKSQAVPPIKLNLSVNKVEIAAQESALHQRSLQVPEVDLVPPYDLIASPGVAEPPVAQQPPPTPTLQQNNIPKPAPFFHRMSEGSSCSDADSSLKRSKRARRPNKFYGYTSDDENTPGTPLIIGSRTFKPQPPPQLTWRKEDLPAPSKSILLNKQPRSPRTPKTPAGPSGQVKKRGPKKKLHKLPPIPTLKIRSSKIGIATPNALPPSPFLPPPVNNAYSSSRDDSEDSDSSDDDLELPNQNTTIPAAAPLWTPNPVVPPAPPAVIYVEPPPPPPPQASVFNQKIPPALLPNPDFATIQYFKRNNIRYPIRPPAGARQPRDGESVYCYCRCPYDEVSEMIACDGENCLIEWFHFECVGIMVAPQGKWFCAECRPKYSNELYPQL